MAECLVLSHLLITGTVHVIGAWAGSKVSLRVEEAHFLSEWNTELSLLLQWLTVASPKY